MTITLSEKLCDTVVDFIDKNSSTLTFGTIGLIGGGIIGTSQTFAYPGIRTQFSPQPILALIFAKYSISFQKWYNSTCAYSLLLRNFNKCNFKFF